MFYNSLPLLSFLNLLKIQRILFSCKFWRKIFHRQANFSPALPPQGDCRPEARKEEHCRLHPQVGKRPRTSVRQQRQEQQQQDDISRYKPPHGSSLSNQPSSLRLFYPHFDSILFLIQVQFANFITKACFPTIPIQINRGPFVPSDLLQVRLRQGITFTFYEDQL